MVVGGVVVVGDVVLGGLGVVVVLPPPIPEVPGRQRTRIFRANGVCLLARTLKHWEEPALGFCADAEPAPEAIEATKRNTTIPGRISSFGVRPNFGVHEVIPHCIGRLEPARRIQYCSGLPIH